MNFNPKPFPLNVWLHSHALLDLVWQLHVLWVILQAGDKLLHGVFLKADLMNSIEKGEP